MTTMTDYDPEEGLKQFARFRSRDTKEKIFRYPTCHPSQPTGFCHCDDPFLNQLVFYLRATLLTFVLLLPFNMLSIGLLRRMGAQIGENVYITAGTWIDPMFPELLTIEDNVLIGNGAKIGFHEFRTDEFVAGRVIIRKGAIIGAFSMIGPGVEIGENATVAGGAALGRDVPPHAIAGGNPARIISK